MTTQLLELNEAQTAIYNRSNLRRAMQILMKRISPLLLCEMILWSWFVLMVVSKLTHGK
jgi:hypothetical protein